MAVDDTPTPIAPTPAPAPDTYASPYASPYAPPLTIGNPQAAEKYRTEYKQAFEAHNKEMTDAQQAQQMNVDTMSKLLDDTATRIREAKKGQSNLPLIALGAGMMGPGNFGDQVGRGLRSMVPMIEKQREDDQSTEFKLAGLELQKGQLQNMPIAERLKYIQALALGDISGQRAIEQADIRSKATQAPKARDLQPKKIGDYIFTPDPNDPTKGELFNPTTGQRIKTGAGGPSPEAHVDPMAATGLTPTPDAQAPDLDALKLGEGKLKGDLHPEALEGQTEQTKNFVKMLVEGKASLPAGRKINADTEFFLNLAHKYDPSFSQSDFAQRANTLKAFSTGRQGDMVRQLNAAYRHADELLQYAAKLPGNTEWTDWNGLRNEIAKHRGNTDVTQFENFKTTLLGEASKFFHGTASEGAEKRWENAINTSQTPEQLQKAISSLMQAIRDQGSALAEQKSSGMNRTFTVDDLMGEKERDKLTRINAADFSTAKGREDFLRGTQVDKDNPKSSPSGRETPQYREGQTATGANGQKIVFRNGNWVPVQ